MSEREMIEHINGGECEIRMTHAERDRCSRACAGRGEPACWQLPSMTSDWPEGQPVHPCLDCSEANQ